MRSTAQRTVTPAKPDRLSRRSSTLYSLNRYLACTIIPSGTPDAHPWIAATRTPDAHPWVAAIGTLIKRTSVLDHDGRAVLQLLGGSVPALR